MRRLAVVYLSKVLSDKQRADLLSQRLKLLETSVMKDQMGPSACKQKVNEKIKLNTQRMEAYRQGRPSVDSVREFRGSACDGIYRSNGTVVEIFKPSTATVYSCAAAAAAFPMRTLLALLGFFGSTTSIFF